MAFVVVPSNRLQSGYVAPACARGRAIHPETEGWTLRATRVTCADCMAINAKPNVQLPERPTEDQERMRLLALKTLS